VQRTSVVATLQEWVACYSIKRRNQIKEEPPLLLQCKASYIAILTATHSVLTVNHSVLSLLIILYFYCYSFCILYYLYITVYVFFIVYVTPPPGMGPIAVGNIYVYSVSTKSTGVLKNCGAQTN
jgi:hypothetical protein